MIGLDTNVIIRYLVQDDPHQSACANSIIEKAVANDVLLCISQITLCEIAWVLQRCYDISKKELITVIKQLLLTQQIQIEKDYVVQQALLDYETQTSVDFSDCLIGWQNSSNNCSFTYTFDKNAAKKLKHLFKPLSQKA